MNKITTFFLTVLVMLGSMAAPQAQAASPSIEAAIITSVVCSSTNLGVTAAVAQQQVMSEENAHAKLNAGIKPDVDCKPEPINSYGNNWDTSGNDVTDTGHPNAGSGKLVKGTIGSLIYYAPGKCHRRYNVVRLHDIRDDESRKSRHNGDDKSQTLAELAFKLCN